MELRLSQRILLGIGFTVLILWSIGPIYWAIATSLTPTPDLMSQPIHFFPQRLTAYHYERLAGFGYIASNDVTVALQFRNALVNSIITSVLATVISVFLATLGGSKGMTAFARSIGDTAFRLDRIEPMMSNATPRDLRDTTTPQAMAETVQKLVLGDVLSEASRAQLTAWLVGNKTGDTRLRAGVPGDWRVGDKSGAGGHGTTNDVGLFWAPQRKPIIVSVYLTGSRATSDERNAAIAAVARAVTIDARV